MPVENVIGLVKNRASGVNNELRHAAVYLGNGWVVEKPGIESEFGPYRVVNTTDSFEHYWNFVSFPTGFIGTEAEFNHYSDKELPPTIVIFRPSHLKSDSEK